MERVRQALVALGALAAKILVERSWVLIRVAEALGHYRPALLSHFPATFFVSEGLIHQ
jgi:hypothetical protein